MKIFNITQASIFILEGATVLNCGIGRKYKTFLEFQEDEKLKELMKRWKNKEFM